MRSVVRLACVLALIVLWPSAASAAVLSPELVTGFGQSTTTATAAVSGLAATGPVAGVTIFAGALVACVAVLGILRARRST